MRRDMNLESWKIFESVARNGSISKSVDELGIDAPGISRVISSLESAIGTDLFDRSSHPMRLTVNGSEALAAAQAMLTAHDDLISRLKTNTDAMSGPILVGLPPSLLETYMVPFLVDFSRRYPEVHLEATEYTAGLPIDFSSRSGPLDIVISYGPDAVHPNYVQIRYGSGRFVPCASPDYLARHGTPKAPEELAAHIGIAFKSPIRESATSLTKDGRTVPLRFRRELTFTSAATAKSAALIGAGIHPALAELHCWREVESGSLVRILPGWVGLTEELYIYTRPELMRLKRIRTFIEEYRRGYERLIAQQDKVMSRYL
jgi:LysR family transcriptional regulator, regulator for bpeEF and oprC